MCSAAAHDVECVGYSAENMAAEHVHGSFACNQMPDAC